MICKIMRSVVFLSVLISANTYSAETLFYANYEEIDKVVWSYLDKNHPEIRSEELKISVYSFEKVLGTRQEDLINVVLNFKVEHQATKKKKITKSITFITINHADCCWSYICCNNCSRGYNCY